MHKFIITVISLFLVVLLVSYNILPMDSIAANILFIVMIIIFTSMHVYLGLLSCIFFIFMKHFVYCNKCNKEGLESIEQQEKEKEEEIIIEDSSISGNVLVSDSSSPTSGNVLVSDSSSPISGNVNLSS